MVANGVPRGKVSTSMDDNPRSAPEPINDSLPPVVSRRGITRVMSRENGIKHIMAVKKVNNGRAQNRIKKLFFGWT
jgi:hypothetical protein